MNPAVISRNLETFNQQQSELQLNFKDEETVTDAENLRSSVGPIVKVESAKNFQTFTFHEMPKHNHNASTLALESALRIVQETQNRLQQDIRSG